MGVSLPANTLIRQPVNQDLRVENGVLQLTERWKGQYSHCVAVATNLYSTGNVPYSTFTAQAGTLSAAYTTPSPPTDLQWILAQATVDECEAGENGFLQCIWNAQPGTATSASFENWPKSETWNLQWQPENYDVYAYCANPETHETGAGAKSQRVAIEQCLHPPTGQNIMTQKMLFQNNSGVVVELNDNEKKILKWKLEGKHVIKHHPLITQNITWNNVPKTVVKSFTQHAASDIHDPDVEDDPDEDFNLTEYTWVCQGTTITVSQPDVKKNEYTINASTQWLGALSVVSEFYGSGAWEFGAN